MTDKAQVRRWTLHFWKVSGGGTEITARGPWTPPLSTEPDIAVVPAADYDALAVALERALIDEQEATHDYHARGHLLDAVIAERDALRKELQEWICSEICGRKHHDRCVELSEQMKAAP